MQYADSPGTIVCTAYLIALLALSVVNSVCVMIDINFYLNQQLDKSG
jgi:hypothetical protein